MAQRRSEDKSKMTERHWQTVASAIIIGLITWVGVSVSGNSTSLAMLNERSLYQGERIKSFDDRLKEATDDRFTRAEAEREFATIRARLLELENGS